MAAQKSISKIEDQIAALEKQKQDLQQKRAEQIAKLVLKSGLADLDISDKKLTEVFSTAAEQFQATEAQQTSQTL